MNTRLAIACVLAGVGIIGACESTAAPAPDLVYKERPATDWAKDFHQKDRTVRDAAVEALTKLGPDAIPVIVPELSDNDADVRFSALATLANYKADALPAVEPVAARMKDPDPTVRRQAVFVLYHIGDAGHHYAVPALTAGMDDTDSYVRRWSAMALGRMGRYGFPAMDALEVHSHDERDRFVREEAQKSAESVHTDYWAWRLTQGDAHPELDRR